MQRGTLEDRLAGLAARQRFGIELGLGRMARMLGALGDPLGLLPVVHLAGTNGKGSTAACIAAALQQAGHRVGLYTSPHLERFNERVQVDGEPIKDDDLAALLDEVLALEDGATFFEVATALAFACFGRQAVDVAVIETGLGGRLDATNVVRPRVTVLTSIARDHAAILGATLQEIAAEKAGIIKPGVPVVAAACPDAAVQGVLEARAAALGAPLWLEGRDFRWHRAPTGRFAFRSARGQLDEADLALAGPHQGQNAALALAALELLDASGVPSTVSQRRRALATVRWPGRLERRGRFLLDCAHNPAGVAALAASLPADEPRALLFAALSDKDVEEMLRVLRPLVRRAVFTSVASARALAPQQLARLWGAGAAIASTPAQALTLLNDEAENDGTETVLVCGSAYLVGELRALLSGAAPAQVELADPGVEAGN